MSIKINRYKVLFLVMVFGVRLAMAADCASSTYTNPIVYSDYSDPDVIPSANGDGYYMTASSFHCTPGLPILFSEDLVNWEIVNYALDRILPEDFYSERPQHGKGVWAPSIRYHQGEYYIFWGDPDFGIFMVKSSNPRDKWSEPILVHAGKGMIDPVPLWDEDGKAYLAFAWAASRSKFNSVICIWGMNPDGTGLIGNPRIVFDGNDGHNHTCEGPKLYKRNGWYYILCPAGGVEKGWQLALRSKDIYGPYESKVVLEQGDTDINGPHQGGLVETSDGKAWFLHFQEKQPWGRILHLNPVIWDEDWPLMGNNGHPVKEYSMPHNGKKPHKLDPSDNFTSGKIGLSWQWHGNYKPEFGMPTAEGKMRIYSHLTGNEENLWDVPNLLLQKFIYPAFTATAKVKITSRDDSQESGLIVMGRDYCRLSVQKEGDKFELKLIECTDAETNKKEIVSGKVSLHKFISYPAGLNHNYECEIWLRVRVNEEGICHFSYSENGAHYNSIGNPFKAREGKWIGAKIGLFSIAPEMSERGWIDIDSFNLYPDSFSGDMEILKKDRIVSECHTKVLGALKSLKNENGIINYAFAPRNIAPGDKAWSQRPIKAEEWCSGFWPGVLWLDYEASGDERIAAHADLYTKSIGNILKDPVFDHDLGFLVLCSYGNGYRITGNPEYKQMMLSAADSLATLFNPTVGTICSWPRNEEMLGGHNTIMDNMINLELLFWAAINGGSHELYEMAVSHADTTMRYNFRPDGSSYHVAVYDKKTGDFIKACTHQGYSDESMWARGQAWAIYGYTMVFRETGDSKYLDFAQKVADVYLDRLPEDMIPYWDFNDPGIPNCPRDASAACIVASALLELKNYVSPEKSVIYNKAANDMLKSLTGKNYWSEKNDSFLLHSTGHHPAGSEIDYSIIYADYYFYEALNRLLGQRE